MRTRTIVTTVALGICLGLSTVPAHAALTVNGVPLNGLSLSGAQVSSPDVPGDRLPFQSISQQGLGKR
jgi:hypothetical protein